MTHKYLLVVTDVLAAQKMVGAQSQMTFSNLAHAKDMAAKIARDLNCSVHVTELIGTYRPTVAWDDGLPKVEAAA